MVACELAAYYWIGKGLKLGLLSLVKGKWHWIMETDSKMVIGFWVGL